MLTRRTAYLWSAAAVSFLAGLLLVLNESAAGWFLIILGISYIGLTAPVGKALAASNPSLVQWGMVTLTILTILLAVIVGVVFLLR